MSIAGVLLVLLGGAIGTGCRFGIGSLLHTRIDQPSFPYATFLINIVGSFMIGLLAEMFEGKITVSPETRAALLVGVLGGFTTFSSFSLETFTMIRSGRLIPALFNAFGSLFLGVMAVWLGIRIAKNL